MRSVEYKRSMKPMCMTGSNSIHAHAARAAVMREIASRRKSAFQTDSVTDSEEREISAKTVACSD